MADKVDKVGTCRHCGKRVGLRRKKLSPEQTVENNAVVAWNQEHPLERRRPIPHANYGGPRWTHLPERPGDDNRYCPDKKKVEIRTYEYGPSKGQEYEFVSGPVAKPKEFCQQMTAGTYNRGMCNRPVRGEWDGEPMCGLHLSHERRRDKEYQQRNETRNINAWAKQEAERYVKILRDDYGLEADIHYKVTNVGLGRYDGRIVVDPKALLAVLEETFE